MEKDTYIITIEDSATYAIRAESQEQAMEVAVEYFQERSPSVYVEVDNSEEPDIEV